MMRILFINVVVDYSSTGRLVRDLAEGAKKEGHEVKILYGRKSAKETEDTVKTSTQLEVAYHGFMTKFFGRHGLHSLRSTRRIMEEIKEFDPDLIHLHNLHGYYVHVPMLLQFLKEEEYPIVWTLHDFWMVSGSSAYFYYNGCKEWDEGCVLNENPSLYPGSYFLTRQRKNFQWKKELLSTMSNTTYVTVSNWQKEELKKTFLSDKEILSIYNGLDLNLFEAKSNNRTSNNLHLLAVANDWKKSKGLDDLVDLSFRLKKNEYLTMIGLSEKQIKEIGVPNSQIRLLPRTQNLEELVQEYQHADVYLNLSYEETMGMTSAEALACGTPCVTYDQTAVPEMINDEVGMVVEAGDIEGVLKAAREVKSKNISPSICRNYAEKTFNRHDMIESYLALYQKKVKGE